MSFEREADVESEVVTTLQTLTGGSGDSLDPIVSGQQRLMVQDVETTLVNDIVPTDENTKAIHIHVYILRKGGLGTDDYTVRLYKNSIAPANMIYEQFINNPPQPIEFNIVDNTPSQNDQTYLLTMEKESGGDDTLTWYVRLWCVVVGT